MSAGTKAEEIGRDLSVAHCLTHFKLSQGFFCAMFMGAALAGHVTDGISNRHLNKYYFPPLKVVTLLGSGVYWRALSAR